MTSLILRLYILYLFSSSISILLTYWSTLIVFSKNKAFKILSVYVYIQYSENIHFVKFILVSFENRKYENVFKKKKN